MNIYPQDIESVLLQVPAISDAAVVPADSSQHGKIPVALIRVTDSAENRPGLLDQIDAFTREQAGARAPRRYHLVDSIPRNATGKIERAKALEIAQSLRSQDRSINAIRLTIARVLLAQPAIRLNRARQQAFLQAKDPVHLDRLRLDSLARMDLLVAMETTFGVVISPHTFASMHTLEALAQHVANAPPPTRPSQLEWQVQASSTAPQRIRVFQRAANLCRTVAQLHKLLATLEHHAMPADIHEMTSWHLNGKLLPGAPAGHQNTCTKWLNEQKRLMLASGKAHPEPYASTRIKSAVQHMHVRADSPATRQNKTLLVCFAMRGSRRLMIPHAIFLQHLDAERYDVLIISDIADTAFRGVVPGLGTHVTATVANIGRLPVVREYGAIRTFGCSAGTYPAILAAHILGAELGVGVSGRYPSERHLSQLLRMRLNSWRAARQSTTPVLLNFARRNRRDRRFADSQAALGGATTQAVSMPHAAAGHFLLITLAEQGLLANYLENTLLLPTDALGNMPREALPDWHIAEGSAYAD